MPRIRQSAADRSRRLEEGRCPVHGWGLSQNPFVDDGEYWTFECFRHDCEIMAIAKAIQGLEPIFYLTKEWRFLLDGDDDFRGNSQVLKSDIPMRHRSDGRQRR